MEYSIRQEKMLIYVLNQSGFMETNMSTQINRLSVYDLGRLRGSKTIYLSSQFP